MSADIVMQPARKQDDPALREILRTSAMPGRISVSYEREPAFFDSLAAEGGKSEVIVARNTETDDVIGFFVRTVRALFVNGSAREIGYLGQLRFDPKFKYRIPVLRKGFDFWRRNMLGNQGLPCDLTSILDGNIQARRLLEAGKPGFPLYRPIGGYMTLAMRTGGRGDAQVQVAQKSDLHDILTFIRATYKHRQFAPALPDHEWQALFVSGGLIPENFLVLRNSGQITGVLAVWDRRRYRQTVLRSYSPAIRLLRPMINAVAAPVGLPSLPQEGHQIPQAFVFLVATTPGMEKDALPRLLRAARQKARCRGIGMLSAGYAKDSVESEITIRNFRCIQYPSTIYLVHGPDQVIDHPKQRFSPFHQELAFL